MNCIVVASGKGGTGKSCVAAYTAMALAKEGRRTIIIEMGAEPRALDLILGTAGAPFGLHDVLAGECDYHAAALPVEGAPGLEFMGPGDLTVPFSADKMASLLHALRLVYDYIVVDGADIRDFPIKSATTFLMVVTPDTLCARASSDAVRRLYGLGAKEVRLVINNVPTRIIPIDGAEDFDDLIDMVGAQLIAVIPASPKLQFCSNNARQLDPDSLTVKVFESLAGRLMGQRRPLLIR